MIGAISSRTPEGEPGYCAVCEDFFFVEPSNPPGDAPCPRCGCLAWMEAEAIATERPAPVAASVADSGEGAAPLADRSLRHVAATFNDALSELEALAVAIEQARLAASEPRPHPIAGLFRRFRMRAGRRKPRKTAPTSGGVGDPWIDG